MRLPRFHIRRCRPGDHWWRKVYGDERLARGAVYVCLNCPAKTDLIADDELLVDPNAHRSHELRRRLE